MSFFGHGYPDDESDEYYRFERELKMSKNMKRLPEGSVFLMMGDETNELIVEGNVNHSGVHEENHECGLAGCKRIGYRVPENFKYGK
jgi:hypothetical protein